MVITEISDYTEYDMTKRDLVLHGGIGMTLGGLMGMMEGTICAFAIPSWWTYRSATLINRIKESMDPTTHESYEQRYRNLMYSTTAMTVGAILIGATCLKAMGIIDDLFDPQISKESKMIYAPVIATCIITNTFDYFLLRPLVKALVKKRPGIVRKK